MGYQAKETNLKDVMVELEFEFKRESLSYITDFVIPTAIMFLFVECGFFMDLNLNPSLPARAAIAIIPVLIMVTQTSASKNLVPQINYATWLSDFLTTSIMFMLYGVIELVGAFYGTKTKKKLRE